jgi:hypothetical protein
MALPITSICYQLLAEEAIGFVPPISSAGDLPRLLWPLAHGDAVDPGPCWKEGFIYRFSFEFVQSLCPGSEGMAAVDLWKWNKVLPVHSHPGNPTTSRESM